MHLNKEFALFPSLPAELRDKIWVHTIDWRSHVLPRPLIAELAVCHEAREALLEVYRPCFRPVPNYRDHDTTFSLRLKPGSRLLQIQSMGNKSPRSPYANYETDVLYFSLTILDGIELGKSLQTFLFQEAIENIQHVLISHKDWGYRRYVGPNRLVGAPLGVPRPDSRLVLTYFGALKTFSLTEAPRVQISIAAHDKDQICRTQKFAVNRIARIPTDEDLIREKLASRSSFAEGKILIPANKPTHFAHPHFNFDEVEQWIDRKARELPGWNAPEVQYAKIIPDPEG